MTKGDIVLIPFPFTDLSGQKIRPALVLYVSRGEDCVVAFISSHSGKTKSKFDVRVTPTTDNGLKVVSTLKLDKIATLQRKIVIGRIGMIDESVRRAVDAMLRKLFGV